MKNYKKIVRPCVSFALVAAMALPLAACHRTDTPNGPVDPPPPPPTISIGDTETTVLALGDAPIQLTVSVENSDSSEVVWESSNPRYLKVTNDGLVSVIEEPEILDIFVTVKAKLKSDYSVVAERTFTVKAAKQSGQTGYLKADMLNALGNPSITVDGTLTDYYVNKNKPEDNSETNYSMTVQMEDGKWRGVWGGLDENGERITEIENVYERGVKDATDTNGVKGKELQSVYIDKNNQVTRKTETNYVSIPAVWEAQHYWNHLDKIPVADVKYDPANPYEYTYVTDESNINSQYLMTYLAFSLTPMLDETFQRVIIELTEEPDANGDYEIAGMRAQTYPQYTNPTYDKTGELTGWDAMSYSTLTFEFSNIGTTEVEEPTPYTATENMDKLKTALDKMKTATNYTFDAVNTTTSAPSTDEGDYDIQSASAASVKSAARATTTPPSDKYLGGKSYTSYYSYTSGTGKVGTTGHVTADGIVLLRTFQYSGSMDGNNFRTEVTGYKPIISNGGDDDYYEQFAYASDAVVIPSDNGTTNKYGALKGTKSIRGKMTDKLPGFDFAPELFEFTGERTVNKKTVYSFKLRSTSATRDIAMEVSMDNYAESASASSSRGLTINVDKDGNLVSTEFPYSVTFGTYIGYVTTTYSKIGSTELRPDAFNEYVARGWRQSWDEYTMKYYKENASDNSSKEVNAGMAVRSIFGDNASSLPTPPDMMKMFGDDVSGPFYDDETKTLADGSTKYIRYMSLTARTDRYDENSQISKETFDDIMRIATETFGAKGLTLDRALTDVTGGESGRGDFVLVYSNSQITVVITNNHTKNFWIYFYNAGDYTRGSSAQ